MNPKAMELIKEFEGTRLDVYLDSANLLTVGTGHLILASDHLKLGQTITQERSDELLAKDMETAASAVSTFVTVPLNENQSASLISLVFNIGVGAFRKSTLLRKLNGGDYIGAASEILKWDKAGGRTIKGLTRRRQAEHALFLQEA